MEKLRLLLITLTLTSLLASCSGSGPLSLLTGGGPNVAANVQAGKTNNQTLGTSESTEQVIKVETLEGVVEQSNDENKVSTETVENININEIPAWVILLLILGWLLPSPSEIWRGFLSLIRTVLGKE